MPVVDVFNLSGKTVGQVELADEVFGAKVNRDLLHEAVRHFLNSQRAGTHKTKDKSEVSGAGRKLWRQKGTGRARVGSIRSPLWRHGGTVHGPTPRSYDYRFPRQMVAGALRSALSAKLAESKLTVVDAWKLDTHKSKAFRASLTGLHKDCRTTLLVSNGENLNLERASRNSGERDVGSLDQARTVRSAAARSSGAFARSGGAVEQRAAHQQSSGGRRRHGADCAAAGSRRVEGAAAEPVHAKAKSKAKSSRQRPKRRPGGRKRPKRNRKPSPRRKRDKR
jgi:large subunit ribosomal protein L4